MTLRRFIMFVMLVTLVLAPVAKPIAAALAGEDAAMCHCLDCDQGTCPDQAACAQPCISNTAWIPAGVLMMPSVQLMANSLPGSSPFLTGLIWPPPPEPPTAA